MDQASFVVLFVAILAGAPGCVEPGPVSCTDPDNLCTGDPCVIEQRDRRHPMHRRFQPRTVVVAGTLRVPSSGTLSLTAGTDPRGRFDRGEPHG